MYICIYVYMYMYIYICIYVYMYICIYVYMCISVVVCTYWYPPPNKDYGIYHGLFFVDSSYFDSKTSM